MMDKEGSIPSKVVLSKQELTQNNEFNINFSYFYWKIRSPFASSLLFHCSMLVSAMYGILICKEAIFSKKS